MADMESVTLINTFDEGDHGIFLSATLGPLGHLCTREELINMCEAAIADIRAGNGREINLDC